MARIKIGNKTNTKVKIIFLRAEILMWFFVFFFIVMMNTCHRSHMPTWFASPLITSMCQLPWHLKGAREWPYFIKTIFLVNVTVSVRNW